LRLPAASFIRNLGWKSLAEGLTRVLGLCFFILLARVLGDAGYGAYTLPLALAGLLSICLDWGTNSLLLREVARHPDQSASLLTTALYLKCLACLSFLAALWLWPWLLPLELSGSRLLAAGLMLVTQAWMDTLIAWLNAQQHYRRELNLRLVNRLLVLLPQLMVLAWWPEIDKLLWTGALAQGLALGLTYYAAGIRRSHWQGLEWAALVRFLKQGWGFWLANVSWLLYLKLDLVMLPALGRSAQELGWYQGAVRFYELLGLAAYLISIVSLPLLAAKAQQREAFRRDILRAMRLLAPLATLLALLGLGLGPWLIPLLLGPDYQPAGQAFAVLCLGVPAVFLNLLWFSILAAVNQQKYTAWAATACLGCNALLNSLWIPQWGYLGAAWSTVLADWLLWALLSLAGLRLGLAHRRELALLALGWSLWLALVYLAWTFWPEKLVSF